MNQTYSNWCQWSILEQVFFLNAENHKTVPVREQSKNWIHFHFCFVYLLLSIRTVGVFRPWGSATLPRTVAQLTRDTSSWQTSESGRFTACFTRNQTANHQLPPSTLNFPTGTLGTHTICLLWNNWKPYLWNWWYSVDNLGVWMGGKQNVKMKSALVKNLFNIPRVVQDSVTITKEKAFVLLLPNKWIF